MEKWLTIRPAKLVGFSPLNLPYCRIQLSPPLWLTFVPLHHLSGFSGCLSIWMVSRGFGFAWLLLSTGGEMLYLRCQSSLCPSHLARGFRAWCAGPCQPVFPRYLFFGLDPLPLDLDSSGGNRGSPVALHTPGVNRSARYREMLRYLHRGSSKYAAKTVVKLIVQCAFLMCLLLLHHTQGTMQHVT